MSLELDDIQGLIISGFGHLHYAAYLFLQFGSKTSGCSWLGEVADDIIPGTRWSLDSAGEKERPKHCYNLGLTYYGLLRLGSAEDEFKNLPFAYVDGMHSERRSHILGDHQESEPKNWQIGEWNIGDDGFQNLHALIKTQSERFEKFEGNRVRAVECGQTLPGYTEHFGFRDGIVQPRLESITNKKLPHGPIIKDGEFVLGYRNEYTHDKPKKIASVPKLQDVEIGKNGSFLVFCKLQQDVASFWNYVAEQIPDGKSNRGLTDYEKLLGVASKFVGRWPGRAPLARTPDRDDPAYIERNKVNDFLYCDPQGYRTPKGAHMRRANPRNLHSDGEPCEEPYTANRHLIIRRGKSYGPLYAESFGKSSIFDLLEEHMANGSKPNREDDGKERGLLFFAINANIARQFEFIQQTWINNPKFHKNAAGDTLEPSVRLERGPTFGWGEGRPPFRVSISVLKLTSYGSAETA